MQELTLVGNLGNDQELREFNGTKVTNLSVADNRRFERTTAEGPVQENEVIWFDVAVWGAQAEACVKYLKAGRQVLIQGSLIPDESGNPKVFERNDGSPGSKFEVRARRVQFLGRAEA